MKLRFKNIAAIAFMLIYVLDIFIFNFSAKFDLFLPVGFVGTILSFWLLLNSFYFKNHLELKRLLILLFFILPLLLITLLGRGGSEEIYFWFKILAFIVLGNYFYLYLAGIELRKRSFLFIGFLILSISIIGVKAEGVNYLRTADGYLLFTVLCLSLLNSRFLMFLLLLVSPTILFMIGSRFSLAAMLLAGYAMFFVTSGMTIKTLIVLFTPIVLAIVYYLSYIAYLNMSNVHDNRFLRLIFETENDTSLSGRAAMNDKALNVFQENYWLGDYKYYDILNQPGAYAHSFLSFWAELGVLGISISFFIFIVSIRALYFSYKGLRKNSFDNNLIINKFVFMVSIVLLLGFLTSKSYNWTVLYFITGFNIYYLWHRNNAYPLPSPTSTRCNDQ